MLRVLLPADRQRVGRVPFCAYENKVEIRENSGNCTISLAGVRPDLCLFVPTKTSAIVCKSLKKLGVPDGI